MKTAKFLIILLLFSFGFSFSSFGSYIPETPWWSGRLDPTKDVIVSLRVESGRLVYDNNEIVLFEVSISDPSGLKGNICLLTAGGKITMCRIFPWFIIGKTGAQVEFPILEKIPGEYKFQVKFLSNGKMIGSNEIEIIINLALPPFPPIGSVKAESTIINGYEFWWTRIYADENGDGTPEWGEPWLSGKPLPVSKFSPAKKSNIITWGSLKEVGR